MGMDVYGEKPVAVEGEYFRNNVWYWRPLWDFVCREADGVLTEQQKKRGHGNSGVLITRKSAAAIAEKLDALLVEGKVAEFEKRYEEETNALPDEICELCHGTGKRTDMQVPHGCNGCLGLGKRRPFETNYTFSTDNVREFARFARTSGGFRIR